MVGKTQHKDKRSIIYASSVLQTGTETPDYCNENEESTIQKIKILIKNISPKPLHSEYQKKRLYSGSRLVCPRLKAKTNRHAKSKTLIFISFL